MVIVDFSNVMMAALYAGLKGYTNVQLDESMLRHMVLNSIRHIRQRLKDDYGDDIVIACDDVHSWRKDVFPYYKIRRKKNRDQSELDWPFIHEMFAKFVSEIRDNFPYRVIKVSCAEADDIIGTLAHHNGSRNTGANHRIIVASADADFQQLVQEYTNVDIFNPRLSKTLRQAQIEDNALITKILKGDAGDDIPNVLSQDDCFAVGVRQRPLRQTKIAEFISTPVSSWPEDVQRNYHRNKTLIDLTQTPLDIRSAIMLEYENQGGKGRTHLYNYFVKHRLTNLMENMPEF